MKIDNAIVELNGEESPIIDARMKYFVELVLPSERGEQDAERKVFELKESIMATRGSYSLAILLDDYLKITAPLVDDRRSYWQHLSIDIDSESLIAEIAPARNFVNYEEIENLLKIGRLHDRTIEFVFVIRGEQLLSKGRRRARDKFVTHQILDMIGNRSLIGLPLKADIIAVRPGRSMNTELAKAIHAQRKLTQSGRKLTPKSPAGPLISSNIEFDIKRI
jgi:UDP-3-O-[3-hydroxymyristoyl] N-acetylglucosamine deacetylase/3-hydroxyacyl-[acyl-carrier-protein] dehydratase